MKNSLKQNDWKNKVQRINYKTDPVTINNHDTLESIFKRDLIYNRDIIRKNPIFQEFQNKIREINQIGDNKYIDVAEIFTMINTNYGYYDWSTVPYGKFNEIKEFVRNNIDTRYKISHPPLHEFLKKIGYYENKVKADMIPVKDIMRNLTEVF